jgi:Domain of unknown function (DUF7014)
MKLLVSQWRYRAPRPGMKNVLVAGMRQRRTEEVGMADPLDCGAKSLARRRLSCCSALPSRASSSCEPLAPCRLRGTKTPINFCKGLSSAVSIDFDHCFENGDTGPSRRSAKPMKRQRKISKLRRRGGRSGPHITQFASPCNNKLFRDSRDELCLVRKQFLESLHHEVGRGGRHIRTGIKGANEEFLKAHEHYRHKRYKECLVDSLKAFESTMKAICKLRGWQTQPTDTAKSLIAVCLNNGLLPKYLDSQISSVRSLLESGIPTVRNKNGGHGQGSSPVAVPEYLARYALNLTATTILFMVEAHEAEK